MTTETTPTTQAPHLTDIRTIMLEQMKALRSASPDDIEVELKRSKGVNELSQTMINSAKVEIHYLEVTKQNCSPFLEVPPTVHTGNLPTPAAPQLPNSLGTTNNMTNDDKAHVTRTTWVDVPSKGRAK